MARHESSEVFGKEHGWTTAGNQLACSKSLSSPASSASSDSSQDTNQSANFDDCLEVNELMYLGRSCCELVSHMSEFSATMLYEQSVSKWRLSGGGRYPPPLASCSECRPADMASCTNNKRASTKRTKNTKQVFSGRSDPVGSRPRSLLGRLEIRSRSMVRRSVPIPPPVVPLWKELELLGPQQQQQQQQHQHATPVNNKSRVQELTQGLDSSEDGSAMQLKVDLCHLNMETATEMMASNALGRRDRKVRERVRLSCGPMVVGNPRELQQEAAGQISQLEECEAKKPLGPAIYDTPELNAVARADCRPRKLTRTSVRRPSQPPPPPPPPPSRAPQVGPEDGCARNQLTRGPNDTSEPSVEGRGLSSAGLAGVGYGKLVSESKKVERPTGNPIYSKDKNREVASDNQASGQPVRGIRLAEPPEVSSRAKPVAGGGRVVTAREAAPREWLAQKADNLSQVQEFKGSPLSLETASPKQGDKRGSTMGADQSATEHARGGADTTIKLLAPFRAACKSSVWHATKQAIGASKDPLASAASKQPNKLPVFEAEDQFNIRRKSLQDGDVFIYPSHYKDSNVCSACGRDFRVCSCNDSPKTTNGFIQNSGEIDTNGLEIAKEEDAVENSSAADTEKMKTVYKISIATASINQQRNQLRMSSPKILVTPKRNPPTQPQIDAVDTYSNLMEPQLSGPISVRENGYSNDKSQYPNGGEGEIVPAGLTSNFSNADCNNNNSNHLSGASLKLIQEQNSIQQEQVTPEASERFDMEKDYYDQQLTCNLEVGDSIKINSTSMIIGPEEHQLIEHSFSAIDRDTTTTATMINPTIADDYTSIIPVSTLSARRRHVSIKLTSRQTIQASSSESGETSLLLDHYQDPIKCLQRSKANPNSLEAGTVTVCGLNHPDGSQTTLDNSSSDLLEYSPILTSARDYINNVNTNELQVQSSVATTAGGGGGVGNECCGELVPIQLAARVPVEPNCLLENAASSSTHLTMSPMGPTSGDSVSGGLVALTSGSESPKKSIFDGASKAEILEYLEDARERVPEILMAADDVMVINDNELIVVNQLEPGAPATPISIVETCSGLGSSDCMKGKGNDGLNMTFLDGSDMEALISSTHTSQENETATGISAGDMSSLDLMLNDPDKDGLRRDNVELNETHIPQTSVFDSEWNPMNGSCNSQPVGEDNDLIRHKPIGATLSTGRQESHERRVGQLRRISGQGGSFMRMLNTSRHKAELAELSPRGVRARQNSTSSDGSAHQMSSLQMVRLKQLYSNRNSLSSTPSSPQSSASPASLTSSNRTSGNCSAASNFYASSSLSCSSPLLAQNGGPASPGYSRPLSAVIFSPKLAGSETETVTLVAPEANITMFPPASSLMLEGSSDKSPSSLLSSKENQLDDLKSIMRGELGSDLMSFHQETASENCATQQYKTLQNDNSMNDATLGADVLLAKSVKLEGVVVGDNSTKLSVIDESQPLIDGPETKLKQVKKRSQTSKANTSSVDFLTRTLHGHYATMNRLNNYLRNRSANNSSPEALVEFQCLDCDQLIDVDQATMANKSNELLFLSRPEILQEPEIHLNGPPRTNDNKEKPLKSDQLDRAYIAAMNGLPLCKSCEKKRIERKEIISEFVDTELKYGRDLKIIFDEFYRPMQVAGLLSREQINGVFLNLEELMISNGKFNEQLQMAINEALSMGDTYFNILNIGRLFIESSEMLSTYESYCIRQGSAACLLARLAKEKELLRIFLRVSQMENTVLRRMNLAAFLMVPVQRVTRYPLLLNRLYKVTAYHHKDRELLRDAQLKVELHLEHINQQTKGIGATNKIWRRISNLSAPSRRCLINAEDIGYIKLRKTALELLKWDRDETQFIHSGKLHFAPLYEFLTKQKAKPLRYMPTHALLIALGKPNWAYRPDLVKPNFDNKLITPTPGGTGIREAALLLFREKNGRYTPCREPLYLSNCVMSADCSQFNNECVTNLPKCAQQSTGASINCQSATNSATNRKTIESKSLNESSSSTYRSCSAGDKSALQPASKPHAPKVSHLVDTNSNSSAGDSVSMVSTKSLPEDHNRTFNAHSSRSNSLASALPKPEHQTATPASSSSGTSKVSSATIINQLMTKVNSYHIKPLNGNKSSQAGQQSKKIGPTTSSSVASMHADDARATAMPPTEQSQMNVAKVGSSSVPIVVSQNESSTHNYNHLYFHNHLQTYGVYEESFEIHERLTKESMLLRADTPLKTRYWLQMLRYHAKDLGSWRARRNALPNIMMMRHE